MATANTYTPTTGIASAPEGAQFHYWGRWIYPNDIVWDRHGVRGDTTTEVAEVFIAWLNPNGGRALRKAADEAKRLADGFAVETVDDLTGDVMRKWVSMNSRSTDQYVLYEDDYGILVGCPNRSFGYVYVVGWRKEDMS